jgi:tetratricopeptide (TPR) repeat protein
MLKTFPITSGDVVFGKRDFTYQRVLDDFPNTKFIGILTFNISPKADSELLRALKTACTNGTNAVLVTNVPKRYPSYFGVKYEYPAKENILLYKRQLDPRKFGLRLSPYFTFKNHAKVVVTDNLIYLGSSNYSDESQDNLECGMVSSDKALIEYVKDTLFPEVQSHAVPYYRDNFAVAIANLEDLIAICKQAKDTLFDAAYEPWSDYDTNFEEKWIYRTTDSGITVSFLRHFQEVFQKFEDALNVIDSILDEYWDMDELPEQVEILRQIFDEYQTVYDDFNDDISTLFDGLEDLARYDVDEEANRKIVEDYSMEAYDERLNYYAQKAFQEASDEFEELIKESEETVKDLLTKLDEMVSYFNGLSDALSQLLQVNSKIDNTHI